MVKITHLSKSSTVVWFQISNFYHGTTYRLRGRKKVKIRVKERRRFDFSTNEVNKDKIFIFLNQEMPIKIENRFLPQLTYKRLHDNISFWPSGSRVVSFFSILYFIRDFLLYCFNFSIFFRVLVWMHLRCPFQWVNYIAGVRHDWLPWISWLKSTCPNHFQPPQWSSRIVTGASYAFKPFYKKIMKKYRNHQR